MAEHAESLCYSSKYHSKITAGQRLRPMEAIVRQEIWRDTAAQIVSQQLEMCLCTYVNIGTRGSVVPHDGSRVPAKPRVGFARWRIPSWSRASMMSGEFSS